MEKGLGVLMPLSAMPSQYGIGSTGAITKQFIKMLAAAKQKYWQVLPLSPTGYGDSPYQSSSAFAQNPYFIDLDDLHKDGLLTLDELNSAKIDSKKVDYSNLFENRIKLLKIAYSRFNKTKQFLEFEKDNPALRDYALYMTIKEQNDYKPWYEFSDGLDKISKDDAQKLYIQNESECGFWMFTQYIFLRQWAKIKRFAEKNGIIIIGDLPIYVAYDSADVWLNPKLFELDAFLKPCRVAGVPPDYFSADGQLWGNPLYNWQSMKKSGYAWWKARLAHSFMLYHTVRIDHFRGFDRYFAIPYPAENAKNGTWEKAPGAAFFRAIDCKDNIIAEDLGILDEGVYKLIKKTGFAGMRILSFAFDGNPFNPYKPFNYIKNCIAYTGTHDNEPLYSFVKSTLEGSGGEAFLADINFELKRLRTDTLTKDTDVKSICDTLLKILYSSKANVKIVPVQDILLNDNERRTNTPSTISNKNWSWRLEKSEFNTILKRLEGLLKTDKK